MEAEVDDGSAGEGVQVPALKVGGIQHGILRQEEERLNLCHVAGRERAVSVRQCPRDELDGVLIVIVVCAGTLGGGANGEHHPEQPRLGALGQRRVPLVQVGEESKHGGFWERGIERVDVGHVKADSFVGDVLGRQMGRLGRRNGVDDGSSQDQACKGDVDD